MTAARASKPWWASRTIWALIVGTLPQIILAAGELGLVARAPAIAQLAMLLGSLLMGVLAAVFRWQAVESLCVPPRVGRNFGDLPMHPPADTPKKGPFAAAGRGRNIAPLLLVGALLLPLAACGSMPPPVSASDKVWQTYGDPLSIATDTYTEAMRAAGRAHAKHLITDEQLGEVLKVGREVQVGLKSARAALIVYGTTADPSPPNLALAVATVQATLTDLLDLLTRLGVKL